MRYTPLLLHFVGLATMNDVTSRVEQIAVRAAALYSRPTVALEIVQLTSEPQVDPRVLKELLEKDPALTCKILRVVNSSFFGLRREVADLSQALNVLGNKPLRLLVLGFSLPDELFAEMAAEQLQWYWRTTLTRAVAARQLATELWGELGDEAFIVGLMHDIGILALLRELGQPYAKLLSRVIEQRSDLAALERDSLGFDHVELSAALMKHWHLPQRLVDAVAAPKQTERLAHAISVDAELARILHLAELLAQLVGQRRIDLLPELLKAGGAYRDLTKGRLGVVVEKLQPQVEQLADVLSVELAGDQNYIEVLTSAHDQMASLTEELAGQLRHHRSEDEVYTELLQEAQELTLAMQSFLEGKEKSRLKRREAIANGTTGMRPRANAGRACGSRYEQRKRSRHRRAAQSFVGCGASLSRATAGTEPAPDGVERRQCFDRNRQRRDFAPAAGTRAIVPVADRRRNRSALDHRFAVGGHFARLRATRCRVDRQRSPHPDWRSWRSRTNRPPRSMPRCSAGVSRPSRPCRKTLTPGGWWKARNAAFTRPARATRTR